MVHHDTCKYSNYHFYCCCYKQIAVGQFTLYTVTDEKEAQACCESGPLSYHTYTIHVRVTMAIMLLHCVIFMFLERFATNPTPPTLYVGHKAFKSHLPVLLSLLCSVTQLVLIFSSSFKKEMKGQVVYFFSEVIPHANENVICCLQIVPKFYQMLIMNQGQPIHKLGQRFCWMQYVPFPTLIITILVFETSFRPYTSGP